MQQRVPTDPMQGLHLLEGVLEVRLAGAPTPAPVRQLARVAGAELKLMGALVSGWAWRQGSANQGHNPSLVVMCGNALTT